MSKTTEAKPKIYVLTRHERQSPDQALGAVAHVVEWPDGSCILKWVTWPTSEERYLSMDDLRSVRLSSSRCTLD